MPRSKLDPMVVTVTFTMERSLPRKHRLIKNSPIVTTRPPMTPLNSNLPPPAALEAESAEVLGNIRALL